MILLLSLLCLSCIYIAIANAQYTLEKDFFASDFFDSFDFFSGADPTHGFVEYNGRDDSLISSSSSNAQMRVSTQQSTPNGRPSIRISSVDSYKTGLIILDLDHMPGGICGTWPAFWTVGENWPIDGEIDIIEGVNDDQTNQATLHTGVTCDISSSDMTGTLSTSTCLSANGDNAGCGVTSGNTATYGSGFNGNGGGVYATDISANGIVVWFFPRNSVPQDITDNSPNPGSWPTPFANFSGSCDFNTAFQPQKIVFDTTFCGDWAGNDWGDGSCASKASTCNDYVANNGGDFKDAYWSINALKVFQQNGNAPSSPPAPAPTSTAAPPPPSPSSPSPSNPVPTTFPPTSIPATTPPPPPTTSEAPPPPTPSEPAPTPTTFPPPPPASTPPPPPPASTPPPPPAPTTPSAPTTFITFHRPGQQPTFALPPGPPGPPGPPDGNWGDHGGWHGGGGW